MTPAMTALATAAAMATVVTETEKRSRMMDSLLSCLCLCLGGASPQRILLEQKATPDVVDAGRVRTTSFRKRGLFYAPSMQQPREAVVSFDAARLGIDSVIRVALPGELLLDGPWPPPHCRI